MKAYKIELLVVDFDEVGEDIIGIIETARYPNHCIDPRVQSIEWRDIGEWSDSHPLNQLPTMKAEFNRLFQPTK